MTASYLDFQAVPDDNQASPPLGAPEGNYPGNVVNNTFRNLMAAVRNLGDSAFKLSGDTFDATSRKIINLAAATLRSDAVRFSQFQDGEGIWGGVSGGSANAQTLTTSPALTGGYRAGQLFRGIAGFTNTGAMTVNVNGNGEVALTSLYGNALEGGEWQSGRRQTIEHDGTAFRMLDPSNRMEQSLYNLLFPVGFVQIKNNQTAPVVPGGITATWTRISTDSYLRGASGAPGSGGSLNTSSAGAHDHGGTTGANQSAQVNRESGGNAAASQVTHTHSIPSESAHLHTIAPTYRSFSVWERTA